MFSRSIETEHWTKLGYDASYDQWLKKAQIHELPCTVIEHKDECTFFIRTSVIIICFTHDFKIRAF